MNINKKLLNICIICLIIYLIYQSSGLWLSIFTIFKKIAEPLLISFLLAYAFYPLIKWLRNKGIPKTLSLIMVILSLILIIFILIFLIFPILLKELTFMLEDIIIFFKQLSYKYNISFDSLEKIFLNNFHFIIQNASIIPNLMNSILSFISTILICFSIFIYLLIDMDEFRNIISTYVHHKNIKIYSLLLKIDSELKTYFTSFGKIMLITLIEYTLSFLLIGHPSYIMLGFCAAISSLIPCFGGIIVNVVASITAFVIGKKLFIRTIILFIILSIIDSYIINPLVYGKTSHIKPIFTIIALFIGGILFGTLGIIISMPCTIIIITIINHFKEENHDTKT